MKERGPPTKEGVVLHWVAKMQEEAPMVASLDVVEELRLKRMQSLLPMERGSLELVSPTSRFGRLQGLSCAGGPPDTAMEQSHRLSNMSVPTDAPLPTPQPKGEVKKTWRVCLACEVYESPWITSEVVGRLAFGDVINAGEAASEWLKIDQGWARCYNPRIKCEVYLKEVLDPSVLTGSITMYAELDKITARVRSLVP